ncbi:MAG: GNAT family N-acetyltransferase [Chloroflexota bacterium]|nr:GNAT family N-acetyltransferase [Chloroflexota bacterium]
MLELRSFRDDDTQAVRQLHHLALDDVGAHGGRGRWEDDLRDIRGTYIDSGGDFLVGLLETSWWRWAASFAAPPTRRKSGACACTPSQRCGFGRLLLERLEERARALGCRVIRLDTTEQQTAAQRLYESAGYRETGRRQTARFRFIDSPRRSTRADTTERTYRRGVLGAHTLPFAGMVS